jgi:hypothetical protein
MPLPLLLAVMAIALFGLIARFSLAEYLASVRPSLAILVNPYNPTALLSLAGNGLADLQKTARERASRFNQAEPSQLGAADGVGRFASYPDDTDTFDYVGELTRIRELATRAAAVEPLSFRAQVILGKVIELGHPEAPDAPRPYYEKAERLSIRATEAVYWLMTQELRNGAYASAANRADILLRTASRATDAAVTVLANIAEKPGADEHVLRLLRADPPWKDRFFAALPQFITDARTPLLLMSALKETGYPPTDIQLKVYLTFLMSHKFYDLAYYTWLQFMPPEALATAGLVFNGGFDRKPSDSPFDWTVRSGSGSIVDFQPFPDEFNQALTVNFSDGRVDFDGVKQILMLSQGTYTLTGRVRGNMVGRRGLRWRISCLENEKLAETPMHTGLIPTWQSFEITFAVPEGNCTAQQLSLVVDARSSSERFVEGTIWYDDIAVRRLGGEVADR